jgi:hypothetical protein
MWKSSAFIGDPQVRAGPDGAPRRDVALTRLMTGAAQALCPFAAGIVFSTRAAGKSKVYA